MQHHELQLQQCFASQPEQSCSLYAVDETFGQTLRQTAARTQVCCLMVSTLENHVITWITTRTPTPRGWKAELAWLVDP